MWYKFHGGKSELRTLTQVVSQFVTRGRKPRQSAWKSAEAPVGKPCFWIFWDPIALHIVTLLKLGNFRHPPCAGSTCSVYIYMCVFFPIDIGVPFIDMTRYDRYDKI
jgi:hypothetical protein